MFGLWICGVKQKGKGKEKANEAKKVNLKVNLLLRFPIILPSLHENYVCRDCAYYVNILSILVNCILFCTIRDTLTLKPRSLENRVSEIVVFFQTDLLDCRMGDDPPTTFDNVSIPLSFRSLGNSKI